ncbi:ion channel [Flavobacterium sp.]|jgi:inward rectifier potassium channel|uniref:ion channel n=1 Tax=Flavobacterium sp. TaxID=239 RepID=UPI002A7FAEE5|nr:ion channel [Flavobacterium sp.]
MDFLKRINTKAKTDNNTGFGSNSSNYGGRFLTKNGNANVRKDGIGFFESISWYHTMLNIPRWKFLFIILLFYIVVNLFFAILYYLIGVEHLNGITANSNWEKFGQAYFFSIQTYTTVGYGHINPTGFLASLVSSIEALIGLLTFAIATGLFFGRFSRPSAFVRFSENAVIAPYQNGKALMFRLAPFKNTNLVDAEARLTVGISVEENDTIVNKFYTLPLEMERINALTLSWTIVHPINEESPLFAFKESDYENIQGEFLVFFKTFEDMYSSTVVKRTSYTFKEVVYGAKFLPMFTRNNQNDKTILHLDKLNAFEKVKL